MSEAPRASIFISYASENREAARLLRDALAAEGLDVWYDESELGGGDAWDQKIRRQIRDCTYFMPVISAQTEARREGYFRREWRLAVDRSHDMADDAMFLVPVVIDGTTEGNARVPEKFMAVQWLKVPGGVETPGLRALARKLASGLTHSLPPASPPPLSHAARPAAAQSPAPAGHAAPLPMPPFPKRPADRDRLKYLAEVLWWVLTTVWMLYQRLPKWGKALVILWIIFGVVLRGCSSHSDSSSGSDTRAAVKAAIETAEEAQSLKGAAGNPKTLAKHPADAGLKSDIARAGAEIANAVSQAVEAAEAWTGRVELIPFSADPSSAEAAKRADEVFSRVFSRLSRVSPDQLRVQPAQGTGDLAALSNAASKAGDDYVAIGRDTGSEITVVLLGSKGPEPLWTGHFPLGAGDAAAVADQVSNGLLAALRAQAKKPGPTN